MKQFLGVAGSALLLSLVAACSGTECTEIGCGSATTLSLEDASGQALSTFTATVTYDGNTIVASCDNGTGSSGAATCSSGGGLTSSGPSESQPAFQVEASEPGGASFSGSISPMYTVDDEFNGPGCGTCTSGEATVTLQ